MIVDPLPEQVVDPASYTKAILNVLADFSEEKRHLEDTQRAILNILEDAGAEKSRLEAGQKATLNILEDFSDERAKLADMQRAVLNILEDSAAEKARLEATQKAVLNILDDFDGEKNKVEHTNRALAEKIDELAREIVERTRLQQQIQQSLEEKVLLLKEVHHRVKNNLQIVASLLSLQAGSLAHGEAFAAIRESETRVRAMSLLHELLYQSGNLAQVDFGDYLKQLVSHLFRSHGTDVAQIHITVESVPANLSLDLAIPCGLITTELVTNSLKYAFPEGRKGQVKVGLGEPEVGTLLLSVEDTGKGLPEGFDLKRTKSMGLRLVQSLSRQIDGALSISSGTTGTRTEVTFKPLPASSAGGNP